jgi:signal transduction histidine kinase
MESELLRSESATTPDSVPLPIWKDTTIIGEFLTALADRRTYNPRRNGYVFFGLLWGIPIPVVTVGVDLYAQSLFPTARNVANVLLAHPFQIFFLLHPLLFGILFGALGTVRDRKQQRIAGLLTDLHARLEDLEALNAQLRETDQVKDEFLSMISHELKTPIVTVRGYSEMLLRGRAGPIDVRQTHIIEVMLKNIDRQIHLIDDLLNYIRIGAHPDDRERQAFDWRDVILHARDTFGASLEKKGLTLELALPKEPLMVYAHPHNAEIVLGNLLSNAIKFTDRGGQIRIESADSRAGRIVTWCSDTGCGIPPEAIHYIFERFRQADGSTRRKHGGTGLGLAITKKILDNYGCSIRVQSRVGEGTTFYFELPAAAGQAPVAVREPVSAGPGR